MNNSDSILLIEDTESHAEFVIKILKHHGYIIHWENTGKGAVEYCSHHQPKLILTDIALPDINGDEVIHKIRALQSEKVPMIAITAHSMSETKTYLLSLGFDDYLSKPFTIQELIDKVRKYV